MSTLKVVFVGCNPSEKNTDPNTPFEGTRSGATLTVWRMALGLDDGQCGYINLTKYATKDQSKIKKSDINIAQFKFELAIKLVAATHGDERALSIIMSAHQNMGKLAPEAFIPNSKEEVEADIEILNDTPMPKIIALGEMASWGLTKSKLQFHKMPHPSGLNHKLNDKAYVAKVLEDCKKWLYNLP